MHVLTYSGTGAERSYMVKDRDLFILRVLEKVGIANNQQLMILCGYRDRSVIRKRIKNLIEEGFITSDWIADHLAYALTQAGLSEIERTRRPCDIRGIKSEHEELVTEAACFLYAYGDMSIYDMLFDHELNSLASFKKTGHKPDIVYAKHNCIEVELSHKKTYGDSKKTGLDENYRLNALNYSKQLWIIPDHKPGLAKRIEALAEKYSCKKQTIIMFVSELHGFINQYDISNNAPRTSPIKGIPEPLKRQKGKVTLYD